MPVPSEIFSCLFRHYTRMIFVCAVCACIYFFAGGQSWLIPAFLLGEGVAMVFVWSMVYRLGRVAKIPRRGKQEMLRGFVLRLLVVFLVLLVAGKISQDVFWSAATGFLACYALFLIAAWRQAKHTRQETRADETCRGG